MKRVFMGLVTTLVATLAIGVTAVGASPVTTTLTCNNQVLTTKVTQNLSVPAGSWCQVSTEVTGNVSSAGYLFAYGATFDKNVSVTGGFVAEGPASSIGGNMSITGSSGPWTTANGRALWWNWFATDSVTHITGNFSYVGNFVPLVISPAGLDVGGNFSYANNTDLGSVLGFLDPAIIFPEFSYLS